MERNLSNIKERILYYTDIKSLNKTNFFENIGITYGNFKGKQKKTTLNSDILDTILTKYPDINPNWLITGSGDILNKEHGVQKVENAESEPGINYEKKGVPYFDVDFIGGFDLVVQDQTVNPSFYIDFAPFNDADYWVNVTGKSMSPFISHGDIIALQVYHNWERFLLGGEIYAIITDDFRTVKILQDGVDDDHFSLIPYSKDPNFKTQQLPKELVKQVFKVKGAIKKFF